MNTLQQRSVQMRFSSGMPGQHRKDKRTTQEIKHDKGLGEQSGKWVKDLWPEEALAGIKTKINQARDYHNTVTLPFGVKSDEASEESSTPPIAGIGILPAGLIKEYGDKMRQFKGEVDVLVAEFLDNPQQWVDWAVSQHNGTFEDSNYPGCENGKVDADKFRSVMRKKFYLRTEPLPVPDSTQFTNELLSLLGVDAESVNIRVRDAEIEAQRELLRRMIAPVKAMAEKLVEQPKGKRKDIVFCDTLVSNIKDIAELVPKLNIAGDPQVDAFAKEMEALTRYSPDILRDDKDTRSEAAKAAEAMLQRLSGYKL